MATKSNWIGERSQRIQFAVKQGVSLNVIYPQEAEPALLANILQAASLKARNGDMPNGNRIFLEMSSHLKADDFYSYRNMLIFRAMEVLHFEKATTIDSITVATELENRNLLNDVSKEYLKQLTNGEYGVAPDGYALQVKEASLRRAMLVGADDLKGMALDPNLTLDQITGKMLSSTHAIITKSQNADSNHNTLSDLLPAYVDSVLNRNNNPALSPYIPTGFYWLDQLIGGLCKGKLYVFAGAPKMGKSTILEVLAYQGLKEKKRVLYFSLEMSIPQLLNRLFALASAAKARAEHKPALKLKTQDIEFGKLQTHQVETFKQVFAEIMDMQAAGQFIMKEMIAPTLDALTNCVIQAHYNGGFDLVVVDYLGGDNIAMTQPNEVKHISEMVLWADKLAREYNVPVAVGAQINRNGQAGGKRAVAPTAKDIKGSSTFEEKAQFVGILHRPCVYNPQGYDKDYMELIVTASRGTPSDTINLHFDGESSYVYDWDKENPVKLEKKEEIKL